MRVICLVPSWTETLIAAGVNVVGRTRFCIHPNEAVKNIAIVGGTKDVDWGLVQSLGADLVILDREENTLEMAQSCPLPWYATHVRTMKDLPREILNLSEKLSHPELNELAQRWKKIIDVGGPQKPLLEPPALVHWVTPQPINFEQIVYVIWAHPWMAAGSETFIGSVLKWCGFSIWGQDKYPRFEPAQFDSQTLFLCSTEPYPFGKKAEVMKELPGPVALVDGERISWFGIRVLAYLESLV